MTTRRLFIHIGKDKSGSTSIQKFLTINHDLLSEFNFYYPCEPAKKYVIWEQHAPLVPALIGEEILNLNEKNYLHDEAMLALLDDLGKMDEDVILSSEFFSKLNQKEQVETLKSFLKGFEIWIIVYLRRQDDYFLSRIQEESKVGIRNSYDFDFLINHPALQYYEQLRLWGDVFGNEHVLVNVFEPDDFYRKSLYADFLRNLGIEMNERFVVPERMNRSMSLHTYLFLKNLNEYFERYDGGTRENWLQQKIRENVLFSKQFVDGDMKSLLNFEVRERVFDYFKEDNKKIKDSFVCLNEAAGEFLFAYPEKKAIYASDFADKYDFAKDLTELLVLFSSDYFLKDDFVEQTLLRLQKRRSFRSIFRFVRDYFLIKKSGLFDEEFYLTRYDDVRIAKKNPILHYVRNGWLELRDPSKDFVTREYLRDHLTLIDERINPLVDYINHQE